ncbi:avidin/streptavidin family protein [Nitratireductor pacificus]|nr:avidin/streptavidin family protein [Nitratireductor pacificus]
MLRHAVAASFLTLATSATAYETLDQTGFEDFSGLVATSTTWVNEHGSMMTITVSTTDQVSGHYVNHARDTGCQNTPYPLTGRVNGQFIAFSVAWRNGTQDCRSATGWTGYARRNDDGTIQIVTDWNLSYQGGSEPAIERGQDLFSYVPPSIGEAPPMKE